MKLSMCAMWTIFFTFSISFTNSVLAKTTADLNSDDQADIVLTSGWGIGLLTKHNDTLRGLAVQRNGTFFGNWKFNSHDNRIHALGKFDQRSGDDILLTSPWGIGILTWQGPSFVSVVAKPNDTWFGAWKFHSEKDRIHGVGQFNGDKRDDIVVTSSWGIGILSVEGNEISSLTVAKNKTLLGEWKFDSRTDRIQAIADFDGDGRDDMLVTSSWGVGILAMQDDGSLSSIFLAPNGTRFGEWSFNSVDNQIHGIGDFNRDGKADVLVTSPWGMSILTLIEDFFTSLVVKPNGTWFGQWNFNSLQDRVHGVGDFNGDGHDDILLTSNWGVGILSLSERSLTSVVAKKKGTWFGRWNFNPDGDTLSSMGDFNNDGYDDILITSRWGMGILALKGDTLGGLVVKRNGTFFGGWRFSSNNTVYGSQFQSRTDCKYGDPACSPCVANTIGSLMQPNLDIGRRSFGFRVATGFIGRGRPRRHVQGVARLSDVLRDSKRIGRVILTDSGVLGGFSYAEQESSDGGETVFNPNADLHITQRIPILNEYSHAGGAQAHGDTVAVALEEGPKNAPAGVYFLRFPAGPLCQYR